MARKKTNGKGRRFCALFWKIEKGGEIIRTELNS